MARLPGAALAEGRGDRPVHGPDEAARALPDRTAAGEVALDARLLGLHRPDVLLELVTRSAGGVERGLPAAARAGQTGLPAHQPPLDGRHLVAPLEDPGG